MIPIHRLKDEKPKEIRVIKLGSLSSYNSSEPHRHDYIELFVFNNGGGTHDIDFVPFDVKPKSIHLVTAGRVHQMKRALNSDGFVILFHPSIFEFDRAISEFLFELDCFDVTEIQPCFTFNSEDEKEVIAIAEKIWKYNESNDQFRSQMILIQLNLLCIYCLRQITETRKERTKDQSYYFLFRELLKANYTTQRKVQYYADKMGITARKLNEIVTEKSGLNVSKLIQKQIILEAKRLLNSGIASKEVAYTLHFEDPAHFSKFFKNQTGFSPSHFQKVHP